MLPPLFLDLAIILVTAGVITVIFKWLKQPLVLGYIVAGFFIGPYFPWFPAITDDANIHVWSDIGIVFLMFALGLEFSIKKLKKVGGTGAITALTELFLMFLIGSSLGKILGFAQMDCIFLGCMLSISSTTIIIKSFDDLKLKQQKFTGTVTAVLVVEDLIAVLLLVVLSTISVSKSFNGGELGMSLVKLVFFLIVWFMFGIYLIPTFLKWMRKWMTEETLCIVAVGLCFGMVVFASYAGFSSALGAFVMGAILSETIEADTIHRIITPLKNLFGAVFFVSVGMLVNPEVLVNYIVPILVVALTVVLFKSSAATLGVVLSGKSLKTAVQSGFCFCQIGEFSFIIAELGRDFGVIDANLYPIIVSVSIITTFVTPYMIKGALPFYDKIYPKVPDGWKEALERYSDQSKSVEHDISVKKFLKKQLSSILIYGAILTALSLLSFSLLGPFVDKTFAEAGSGAFWGRLLAAFVTLAVIAPFVWAMAVKNVNRDRIKRLLSAYGHSRAVVVPVLLLRYFMATFFVGLTIAHYINMALGFAIVLAVFLLFLFLFSRHVMTFYHRIEDHFVSNFNKRQAQNAFRIPKTLEQYFYMEKMVLTPYSILVGKRLFESRLRQDYAVNVVSVERGGKIYDLPDKDFILMPQDRLTMIGNEERLAAFRNIVEVEPEMLVNDYSDHEINIYRYEVVAHGSLCGNDLMHADFQRKYNAMVIAIERRGDYLLNPPARTIFVAGDIVWFVSPELISLQRFEMM